MNNTKKIVSVLVCVFMVLGIIGMGMFVKPEEKETSEDYSDSLVIWYVDEEMSDYLNRMAFDYREHNGIRVIPKLMNGDEYIESIYEASVKDENPPDLYILSNDTLEKAYLSGCAVPIDDMGVTTDKNFSKVALHAVTYDNDIIAYPYYFETSVLLYNKTYLHDMAENIVIAENESEETEEDNSGKNASSGADKSAEATGDSNGSTGGSSGSSSESSGTTGASSGANGTANGASGTNGTVTDPTGAGTSAGGELDNSDGLDATDTEDDEMIMDEEDVEREKVIAQMMSDSIPSTFDEIMSFADNYDAPMQVESVFKWDVRDIFFNYFFIGNYMDIGGIHGDDPSKIDIYNENTVKAMQMYQDMNQFFSFESEDVTYDQVVNEFISGKLVFATATSDIVAKLKEAADNGDFEYEYGIAPIPNLNEELVSKGMSVTNCIVINGYSDKQEEANNFARYLAIDKARMLYEEASKMPAATSMKNIDETLEVFAREYEKSVPMPKLMATADYWLMLESTFADIWSGKDVSKCLEELEEKIKPAE
ncbi:MAG: sugar ABC transporter substrate-binding protein [Lachnospiraceae bacterium]|nr:sugar ABC transporter substrate-binding protein [Lachnospiraceae bacterium]